jgi:hypothetical protein
VRSLVDFYHKIVTSYKKTPFFCTHGVASERTRARIACK